MEKKTMKAWAVVFKSDMGLLNVIPVEKKPTRKEAKIDFLHSVKLIPCTITYTA